MMQYIEFGLKIAILLFEIILIIRFVALYIKAKKVSKTEENQVKEAKTVEEFEKLAMEFIVEAENFKDYSGEERLNYAVTRLLQVNQNLYGESQIIELVNRLVDLTNKVNVHKKK